MIKAKARPALGLLVGSLLLLLGGCTLPPLMITPISAGPQGIALILDPFGQYLLFSGPVISGVEVNDRPLLPGRAHVFNSETGELHSLALPPGLWALEARWAGDGSSRLLLVTASAGAGGSTALQLYDLERDRLQSLVTQPGTIRSPQLSPDGGFLAFLHTQAQVELGFTGIELQVENWSLQIRSTSDPQQLLGAVGFVTQARVRGVAAYTWTEGGLLLLEVSAPRPQPGAERPSPGQTQLALKRLPCSPEGCEEGRVETLAVWPLPPEAAFELYFGLGFFFQLPSEAFLAVSPEGGRAVVAVARRVNLLVEEGGEEELAIDLYEVDLATGRASLLKPGGFFPAFSPEGKLAYLASFGLVARAEPDPQRPCLSFGDESPAFLCVEEETAVYLQEPEGTERRLTAELDPAHLAFGQLFWLSEEELGYVELLFRVDEEGEKQLAGARLKAVEPTTGRVRDLSQEVLQALFSPEPFPEDCTVGVSPFERDLQRVIAELPEGGVLCLGPGPAHVNLEISKSLTLRGVGQGRTLLLEAQADQPVIRIRGEAQVTLEQVEILGVLGKEGTGIRVQEAATVTIRDSTIQSLVDDSFQSGLEVEDSARVILESVVLEGNKKGVNASGSAAVVIRQSTVSGNDPFSGVTAWGSATVTLFDSTVSDNGGDGILVTGRAQGLLVRSRVVRNEPSGLYIGGEAVVTLRELTIEDNGNDRSCQEFPTLCNGVTARGQARLTIADSRIIGNADWGVAARLSYCGFREDDFRGEIELQGNNVIEGNDRAGNFTGDVCLPQPQPPQELRVPHDVPTLQQAVVRVPVGGTILVEPGKYRENLIIYKSLTLRGPSREEVVIEGQREDPTIHIEGSIVSRIAVTVENLTVTGGDGGGILIEEARATIRDSRVQGGSYGIRVGFHADAIIEDNIIRASGEDGIVVDSGTVELRENVLVANGGCGLRVRGFSDKEVRVEGDRIASNGRCGIGAEEAGSIEVRRSTVEGNGTDPSCLLPEELCSGLMLRSTFSSEVVQLTLTDSVIRGNTDWGIAAALRVCGFSSFLEGRNIQVRFEGENVIEGNNTSRNQDGLGNPGDHPWNRPDVEDGQVCLP